MSSTYPHAPSSVVATRPEAGAHPSLFRRVIATPHDAAATVARIGLALVILPHGLQKVFGWFGGPGFEGTMGFFATLGIPAAVALGVVLAESIGALALLFGLVGRFFALAIAAVMAGAIALVHVPNGFFMNWMGTQAGEGFEFHLLAIALALVVIIRGSGAFSLDRLMLER